MSHDELEFVLAKPVRDEEALDVAIELYGFSPDAPDAWGTTEDCTVGALADALRNATKKWTRPVPNWARDAPSARP